jgi:inner membrane protein
MSNERSLSGRLNSITTSSTAKFIAITILLLLLLIPKSMVTDVINDRKEHRDEARRDVSAQWGGPQVLAGPFLVVPYEMVERSLNAKKELQQVTVLYYAVFLPDNLQETVEAQPQVRHRGIYEVVLYQSKVALKGSFPWPNFGNFPFQPSRVLWNKAALVQGLSDIRGIQKDAKLTLDGRAIPLEPGLPPIQTVASGIHANLDLSARRSSIPFQLDFTLNGAGNLSFIPLGRQTTVDFSSPWPSPSFQGAFLPSERKVGPEGFKAKWEIPNLARNFPQQWTTANSPVEFKTQTDANAYAASEEGDEDRGTRRTLDLGPSTFGVSFFYPVDNYQTTTRSSKYGVLFLALTFLIFFLFEVLSGVRIHAFQYLLVGFALILFYLLLLSTSEFIGFGWSYLVAATATIGLITAYSSAVLWNWKQARMIGVLLAFIYAYLYCLLKAEDYSLLLGSIGLFVALAVVMYATRKVDWYGSKPKGKG